MKTIAVGIDGERNTIMPMNNTAGYISPLSRLERTHEINGSHLRVELETYRIAGKSMYFFRESPPRKLAARREIHQIRQATYE
jgi:hypothetical protein